MLESVSAEGDVTSPDTSLVKIQVNDVAVKCWISIILSNKFLHTAILIKLSAINDISMQIQGHAEERYLSVHHFKISVPWFPHISSSSFYIDDHTISSILSFTG